MPKTSTATKPAPTIATDLEKLLASIKSRMAKIEELRKQSDHIKCRLYADVYQYVEAAVAQGIVPNSTGAFLALADTLRRTPAYVGRLYYAGRFMRENGISPDVSNSGAIWLASGVGEGSIAKPDYLRMLSAVKAGEDTAPVAKIIFRGRLKSGSDSAARVRQIQKSGHLTKGLLEMEMLACLTLLRKHFKVSGGQLAFCASDGEILMQVGEDL